MEEIKIHHWTVTYAEDIGDLKEAFDALNDIDVQNASLLLQYIQGLHERKAINKNALEEISNSLGRLINYCRRIEKLTDYIPACVFFVALFVLAKLWELFFK